MKNLANKNILLFSPSFFSYENSIKSAFEEAGANVFLYDERSIKSSLSRAILKVFPGVFSGKTNKYYKSIIFENINKHIDYILIIKCDMVTVKVLHLLKESFPDAKICLYLWDSMRNIRGIKRKIKLFDFASSFDLNDCNNNEFVRFRPLFYTSDFVPAKTTVKYDLSFCGTIHSDRYSVLESIISEANKNNLKTYVFAYLQSHFIFNIYKLFGKGWKKAKKSFFSFEKKPISEISMIEKQSQAVVDIQHPKQTGLTMRTIEMIGAKKKIITTNKSIANYDFYNPNNIMIVDRKNPIIDSRFFETEYEPLSDDVYRKYRIEQWILDVLGV